MQPFKIDLLTPLEKKNIQTDVDNLFADEQIRRSIVLRKKASEVFSPAAGSTVITWTSTPTYAMKGIYSSTEAPSGKGVGIIEFGDFYYLVSLKEITSDPLSKDDRILEVVYTTGLVSVTKGSKTVTSTGGGTEWNTYASKGDLFKTKLEPLSYLNEVATINSATTITLVDNYAGETKSSQPYVLYREYFVVSIDRDTFTDILIKYTCREIS